MAAKLPLRFGFLLFTATAAFGLPEQGVWDVSINKPQRLPFTKSLYNNSLVSVKSLCIPKDDPIKLTITWILRWTPCAEEYSNVENDEVFAFDSGLEHMFGPFNLLSFYDIDQWPSEVVRNYMLNPENDVYGLNYPVTKYHWSVEHKVLCDGNPITLSDESNFGFIRKEMIKGPTRNKTAAAPTGPTAAKVGVAAASKRLQRDVKNKSPNSRTNSKNNTSDGPQKISNTIENDLHTVAKTWEDGIYLFIIYFQLDEEVNSEFHVEVSVRMKGPTGYLSAIEWPLLPFYGAMCVFYVIMALVWMVLSACNWRDLLRIQFWIGAVILLGMLEKAVFFAEYSSINVTGRSVRGAVIFAEIVSCLKRTLARMLVVIVSLGFGIVKPRLGPMLHRVLGMGALYFILGSVEGCLRILKPKSDVSRNMLLAKIPLAVLDAAICWWVFTSLVQTTRTLRLRRNLVKLSLYRHFTNTLIFAVLASVAFMIWSIKQHRLTTCLTDWKEIWVDDAFWHLLFSIILLIIMVLWRPNNNNQRYAFSPLLDAADDEAEEPMINDAYEGMKMRSNSTSRSTSPKPREAKNKPEDDLKWIEENIPASVTDAAIPSLLDSDEEIMTTKFEMSKME